jgi:L-threonylcarbamoyladenylate synthase
VHSILGGRKKSPMLEVLDWQRVAETRAVVRHAVAALQAGRTVAFPTETTYALAANGLVAQAVERICLSDKVALPAVAVNGVAGARDWVPSMSPLAQRLARRFWPGPLTLVFAEGVADGFISRLPASVQKSLCSEGALRLRTPAHAAIIEAVRLFPGPLVLSETVNATPIRDLAGDRLDLLIDDGVCPAGAGATVVQCQGNTWQVVQPGAVSAEQLTQQSACVVVFVCTGNTCRSPLAEGLCKKMLAERLGCAADDLPKRGFYVLSAGLAAMMGGAAAIEAVEVGRGFGADLSWHQSRPLTEDLAAQADFLVAMTRGHLMALTDHYPRLGSRPRLLSPQGDDLADPIGASREVYQECAEQIRRCLEPLIAEILK